MNMRFLLLFFIFTCDSVLASDSIKKPIDIVRGIVDGIYVAGETSGNFKAPQERAIAELQTFIKNNGDKNLLIEKNSIGQTPLIISSFFGYDFMLEELLKYDIVRQDINRIDDRNATAWEYSNFAFRQSVFACHKDVAKNPFVIVPLIVTYPYYTTENNESRYKRVRTLLEDANAKKDLKHAKELWLKICETQDLQTKKNVQNSNDMLDTVVNEGKKSFTNLFKKSKKDLD